jgi:hypothetical protein
MVIRSWNKKAGLSDCLCSHSTDNVRVLYGISVRTGKKMGVRTSVFVLCLCSDYHLVSLRTLAKIGADKESSAFI